MAPSAGAAHPLELANWKKELDLICGLVDRPDRVRIALIGTTGAGKSSFLNAVLGQEVLPIGVMEPCTAFVTAVTHSHDSKYRATAEFCSREEWTKDLNSFIAALGAGDDNSEHSSRGEERRVLEAARKRVEAVYGAKLQSLTKPSALHDWPIPAEAERIFKAGGRESHEFDDAKDLLAYLRGLVRGTSALWPLVTQVSVSGPYTALVAGVELVDLPGLNDPNAARVEVTREFLRTSPFVWVVFSMVRGLTADVKEVLQDEKLIRLLVLSGSLGALSLIGTKADDVDINIADQFGLPEECSQNELIRAYRDQTVLQVRRQLEEMIRDLGSQSQDNETIERMVVMAGSVTVHATSANAYMKLNGIGKLRRDFGIEDEVDTGIPEVHRHLLRIGKEAGAEFSANAARIRLERLREEITFFFRGKAQRPTPELEAARARIQRQHGAFQASVQTLQDDANGRLKLYRERFLEDLDPLLRSSVRGVQEVAEDWEGIHWATLRALVHRDGVFRSPTTGRAFDLNEDLAEPLLAKLPVTWERYFTHDLDRVAEGFVVRLTELGKSFCSQVRLIVEVTFKQTGGGVEDQLRWFEDKVAMLASESINRVSAAVRERRNELAAKMPLVAREGMRPGYAASRAEEGPGMKRRILGRLQPMALLSAQPIFNTIQSDLIEGITDLEAIIVGMFRNLALAAEDQARIVTHNANVDVTDASRDPLVSDLLASMPKSDHDPS